MRICIRTSKRRMENIDLSKSWTDKWRKINRAVKLLAREYKITANRRFDRNRYTRLRLLIQ